MTPKDELYSLLTATLIEDGDEAGRATADRGTADAAFEMQFPSSWPTQHMTATWGN